MLHLGLNVTEHVNEVQRVTIYDLYKTLAFSVMMQLYLRFEIVTRPLIYVLFAEVPVHFNVITETYNLEEVNSITLKQRNKVD